MSAMLPAQAQGPRALLAVLAGALLAVQAAHAEAPVAVGQVTDLQGRPVAGAQVQAGREDPSSPTAHTDAQGRFELALPAPATSLSLTVLHPEFQRWSLYGASPDQHGVYQIRLTRNIGRPYLAELTAQTAPASFQRLSRDLLTPSQGSVGDSLPMAEILPFLKALQPWLRAALPERRARLKRKDLPEPERRALLLLAFLGDPQDDPLVEAWASKQHYVGRPPKGSRGATADAAVQAWRKAHFEKEGCDPQQIPYHTLDTQIAPRGDHGLALLTVRYAFWGYSRYAVLVRSGGAWEVRRVIDHEHWHSQPVE